MLVSELITSVRYKVGDSQSKKWTGPRILDLINEGLDDMSRKAHICKVSTAIPLVPYQRELVIPDDNFRELLRFKINGKLIRLVPFDEIDIKDNWQNDVGEDISLVMYDKQNVKHLTLYPLLSETSTDYDALNDATGLLIDVPNIDRDYLFGIITSVATDDTVTPENVYNPTSSDEYGSYTSIQDTFVIAELTYSAKPTTVVDVTDTLDLDESFKQTLVYYVSGMLLLDDNRTESVNKGTLFLQKYQLEFDENKARIADSSQHVEDATTSYRTGFEY
jgi:hypothetical protein